MTRSSDLSPCISSPCRPRGRDPRSRRSVLRGALLAAVSGLLAAPAAFAAEPAFPQKPVTIIVPFAPGGSLDVTARIVGDKLKDLLGQPVLISNRPGAGSAVGARAAATAPADGYTLFLASGSAFGFLNLLVPNFDFQVSDFAPIGSVATNTSLFAVSASAPIRTLPELVQYARSKPGEINFCTTGVGGLNHLQLEMFKGLAKAKGGGREINVAHIPYNGVAPALVALRTQAVQVCTLPYSALVKNQDGAELRVIAMQRGKRLASMPNVPTTGEQGYPEMDANEALVNLSAPKGTPPAVLARLEDALQKAMQDPVILRKLEEIDVQPTWVGSRETQKWLEDDVRRFSAIIREAGLALAR